jgi:hypothetical protein
MKRILILILATGAVFYTMYAGPGGCVEAAGKADAFPDLKRGCDSSDQSVIADLRPLTPWFNRPPWLIDKESATGSGESHEKAIKILRKSFRIVLREDPDNQVYYYGDIEIGISDSIARAKDHADSHVRWTQLAPSTGSFSGTAVGDWTMNYGKFDDKDCTILFLRKNAFVRVSYQASGASVEAEREEAPHTKRNPPIQCRCEQLAREIDEQLRLLTGQDAK